MPFVFNGTTIPENVANAFSFNGTNITDVFFNGVQVWHQSLFSGIWSGSTTAQTTLSTYSTFETSGNLARQKVYNASFPATWYGAWVAANVDGTFANARSFNSNGAYTGFVYFDFGGYGITSPNGIACNYESGQLATTQITLLDGSLSGGSIAGTTATGLTTSGGLMRLESTYGVAGAYISIS